MSLDQMRARTLLGALVCAALGVLPPLQAWTNPIPEEAWNAMLARPGQYLRTRDEQVGLRLTQDLARSGVDVLISSPDTLALIAEHLDVFLPVLTRAQAPPHVPRARLQTWFRGVAGRAEREAMVAALGRWIDVASDSFDASGGGHHFPDALTATLGRMDIQATGAMALADWDARRSLPAMRGLLRRMSAERERLGLASCPPIGVVQLAIRRLEGGRVPMLMAPDGHGGFRLYARPSEIVSAVLLAADRTTMLDRRSRESLWRMVGEGREALAVGAAERQVVQLRFEVGEQASLQLGYARDEVRIEFLPGRAAFALSAPKLYARLARLTNAPPAPVRIPRDEVASARLVRERVVLMIERGWLRADGRYGFRGGQRAGAAAVRFPAPTDSDLSVAERWNATVTDADGRWLAVPWVDGYVDSGLVLPLAARDSLVAAVSYRQRILGRRAVYLLKTARAWGEPLESAALEVDWPDSLGYPRFSLPLIPVSSGARRTLYRFEAAPFLPDTDLVVTW